MNDQRWQESCMQPSDSSLGRIAALIHITIDSLAHTPVGRF